MKKRAPIAILAICCLLLAASCSEERRFARSEYESEIRAILEVPLAEFVFKDVLYLGERQSVFFVTTLEREALFSIHVRVQAGYNLEKGLTVLPPGPDGLPVVELPRPEILLVDADETSIREYYSRTSASPFGRLEYAQEIERAKPRLLAEAQARGILTQAERNGKALIASLFRLAGFSGVELRYFEAASQSTPGATP